MSLPIDLPAISIPEIPLPLEISELIHPAIVHFVIAIPVVILLLEIYNLVAKRRSISAFSLFLLIIVAVAMFGAYLTGSVDGKATWDILSSDGQADLKAHKLLGTYLVYSSLILLILKLLAMAIRKTVGRVFFILLLGGFIVVTLYQGKEGGELVYKYGANSERVVDMQSNAEDAIEELEEADEKLSELQTKYDELVASNKKEEIVKEEAPEADKAEEKVPEASDDEKKDESEEEVLEAEEKASKTSNDENKEETESNESVPAPSNETNSSN